MKLIQQQYTGTKNELPSTLPNGSIYITSDTNEIFAYGIDAKPVKASNINQDVLEIQQYRWEFGDNIGGATTYYGPAISDGLNSSSLYGLGTVESNTTSNPLCHPISMCEFDQIIHRGSFTPGWISTGAGKTIHIIVRKSTWSANAEIAVETIYNQPFILNNNNEIFEMDLLDFTTLNINKGELVYILIFNPSLGSGPVPASAIIDLKATQK